MDNPFEDISPREMDALLQQDDDRDEIRREQWRLEKISEIAQRREDNLLAKREVKFFKKFRNGAALGALSIMVSISAGPSFKHETMGDRLFDEAGIAFFGALAVGGARFLQFESGRKIKTTAKEARKMSKEIGRHEDGWITEDLGVDKTEQMPLAA
jgi:hypothetical protein